MKTTHVHGNKHSCTNCGARYYDLGSKTPTCPRCSHVRTVITKALARNSKKKLDKAAANS